MIPTLILAGGEGRRLGGADKPLLRLGERSVLEILLAGLGRGPVALSANGDPGRYAQYGVPILPDGEPGQGPLGGVLSGLAWAHGLGADALLSLPGDTPFVPPDLGARLAPAPACAARSGRVHPLVALWPVSCRDALAAWLGGGQTRRVGAFAATIGMRAVWWPDTGEDPFANINTPSDLAAARRRERAARMCVPPREEDRT